MSRRPGRSTSKSTQSSSTKASSSESASAQKHTVVVGHGLGVQTGGVTVFNMHSGEPSALGVQVKSVLSKRKADDDGNTSAKKTPCVSPILVAEVSNGEEERATLRNSIDDHERALDASVTRGQPFRLDKNFVKRYRNVRPPFDRSGLGATVYFAHYSRVKEDGNSEQWFETIERVVNGMYNMQKRQIEKHNLGWKPIKAQRSAQECYQRMFDMKFLPPGRGLWAMGSALTEEYELYAALNNCAFVSTQDMGLDGYKVSKPFGLMMDMSMLGIGVGFDTRGAVNKICVAPITASSMPEEVFQIPDSREGWVESVERLIDSFFERRVNLKFDYSKIRPVGLPLKRFGGTSSGPKPLIDLHRYLLEIFERKAADGTAMSVRDITDVFNRIGQCVVAGNIRRSAQIGFGENGDEEFMHLKDYTMHPERSDFGWISNNTVFCKIGDDYTGAAKLTAVNGEPGYCWLENMRAFSRMCDAPDYKDAKASGGNPCLEQTLEDRELCCLVETFIQRHENMEDFQRTLKFAYLYAKTVTLGFTQWVETNRVLMRNRRIGCSLTGIAQFLGKNNGNMEVLRQWLCNGYKTVQKYDDVYSKWLVIPKSIKLTSIKPSGTVSLLPGSTPGVHYPVGGRYYLRRKRFNKHDPRDKCIVRYLKERGYPAEQCVYNETSIAVAFPTDDGPGIRAQNDVSMWEQLGLAAFMQEHWSDNQVSATITFDESEAKHIPYALQQFQFKLKGVSFMAKDTSAYAQKPYESLTKEQYDEYMSKIQPLVPSEIYQLLTNLAGEKLQPEPERFCDGDRCVM